jgi:hypothetical protein
MGESGSIWTYDLNLVAFAIQLIIHAGKKEKNLQVK